MSSPFPTCFRPSPTNEDSRHSPPPPLPPHSTNPNLTAYLFQIDIGIVSLTWSRSIFGRSIHVQLHHHPSDSPPSNPSPSSFPLHIGD
ncbi:hypothetical protein TSUD_204730 [Trifolium subterraneum]|uniref:Uncharacterized protein n=1 Tax=Trifolium subterraneum TaxID=3900 RepID=A0A2Z6NYK7_TRISU|nr:hypothetical protein TSUD_204730 [Trifolium subterraneum]